MALLMGMVLMGGATALMVRMMGARKLSASESYQQLAEAAAVNGFNRILATLNSPQKQNYLGYLYLINKHGRVEHDLDPLMPVVFGLGGDGSVSTTQVRSGVNTLQLTDRSKPFTPSLYSG